MDSLRSDPELLHRLASELPNDIQFRVYYLSTPQTPAPSLHIEVHGQKPDKTLCSKHFLVIAINQSSNEDCQERKEILVYAVEVLIYFTSHNTTFFISKADSTGYLDKLKLAKQKPSPIRTITTTFLQFLIDTHQKVHVKSTISLFARAQDQYLFPGSVEYPGKHVLNDRGLIRWWCRVLNPILESSQADKNSFWESVRGYIIIPGLDNRESLSYTPSRNKNLWTVGHPLLEISGNKGIASPRNLIPRFPDDPKARFLDELDEEIVKNENSNGQWKNVKTLDHFWEMMAFRQECSAGRLVGFIWIVLSPNQEPIQIEPSYINSKVITSIDNSKLVSRNENHPELLEYHTLHDKSQSRSITCDEQVGSRSSSPIKMIHKTKSNTSSKPFKHPLSNKKRILTGKIITRKPRFKINNIPNRSKNSFLKHPGDNQKKTCGAGQIIIDDADYHRIMELLLNLDFSRLERAISSSSRWIEEARCAGRNNLTTEFWGQTIIGTKIVQVSTDSSSSGTATLNPNLIRKKRAKTSVD
ncbi:putative h3 k56 histone acetylation protein kat11 [Golovinomyces cichoracearum]|uniref:histone acetyltransferase n=1 Tax=Golovinomyces cichoracearum TaxID=62708 RepID=A0A420HL97_9PEZI|nr:putative h3 k56 histone acetylation protein kat11 [Golovinomyces cichoracearum]